MKSSVKILNNSAQVFERIGRITGINLRDLTEDTAKMARQMMQDSFKTASSGELAASVKAEHPAKFEHSVATDAENTQGIGYGAKQEWGWHDLAGKKHKGRHIILRAMWGMRKRYERGEKWRD